MSNFYGGQFFGGGFFGEITVGKTGTGGIDPGDGLRRRRGRDIVKPTGLKGTLHLPKKDAKARPTIAERVEDSRALQAEVAAQVAKDFAADNAAFRARELIVPIVSKPLAQMEAEIAALIQKKRRTEEEEIMLLMLMVSVTL